MISSDGSFIQYNHSGKCFINVCNTYKPNENKNFANVVSTSLYRMYFNVYSVNLKENKRNLEIPCKSYSSCL